MQVNAQGLFFWLGIQRAALDVLILRKSCSRIATLEVAVFDNLTGARRTMSSYQRGSCPLAYQPELPGRVAKPSSIHVIIPDHNVSYSLLKLFSFLAGDTRIDARQKLSPTLGDRFAAELAVRCP